MKSIVFLKHSVTGWSKLKTIDATREIIVPTQGDSLVMKQQTFVVNKIELDYDSEEVRVYLI